MTKVIRSKKVISALNDVLTSELTAINQYFLHGEMCEDWGYQRLYQQVRGHSIGEMKHAEIVIQRILFLEGIPNVQRLGKINIGETVEEQLRLDLALEEDALKRLNEAIVVCRDEGDNGSRALLETILIDEEDHVSWIETQIDQIEQIGIERYLSQQVKA